MTDLYHAKRSGKAYVAAKWNGFEIGFDNGYAVSVIFGFGNYCKNFMNETASIFKTGRDHITCEDAEISAFKLGMWVTREIFEELGLKDPEDDVVGYVSPDQVAEIIHYISKKEAPINENP